MSTAVVYEVGTENGLKVRRLVMNYAATMAFIGFGLVFYLSLSRYHVRLYNAHWTPTWSGFVSPLSITARDLFLWTAALYAVLLVPYYWLRWETAGKPLVLVRYLVSFSRFDQVKLPTDEQRQAICSLLVKFIFVPFVLNGLLAHLAGCNNQVLSIESNLRWHGKDYVLLYSYLVHPVLLNLVFLVDFVPFVVGYLVESKRLGNEVKSTDTTLFGWAVCLLCYPPFNAAYGLVFPWSTADYVNLLTGWPVWFHLVINGGVLVMFVLFASASVSMGWKASNLTSRGLVDSGLYRLCRHPAYAAKNLAWWIAAVPTLYIWFQKSPIDGAIGIISIGTWTVLYALRAYTEEQHLLRSDPDYAGYRQRVRSWFIPGLL